MNNDAYEEGRERYYDQTPDEREKILPQIVNSSSQPWLDEYTKSFAKGWLAEWSRDKNKSDWRDADHHENQAKNGR